MTSPHPDPQVEGEATGPRRSGAGAFEAGSASQAESMAGGAYDPRRKVATRDEASLPLAILRDVAIVSAILSLFAASEAWSTVSRLSLAKLLSVIDGLLVGAATGALAHEWGHFMGARLGGGHAPLKPLKQLLPLYDFDYANNDQRSFVWMSLGGNIAHALVVVILLMMVPTRTMGTAALVAGAFGFAVFSSLVEFPVIRSAQRGVPPLESLAVIPKNFVSRYLPTALVAAFAAYALL